MDHGHIEGNNLVDLYLMDRLSARERAAFEMHFINCESCIEELEEARALQQALEIAWPEERRPARQRPGLLAWFSRLHRSWHIALISLIALLIALPVALLFQEMRRMRRDLDSIHAHTSEQTQAASSEMRPSEPQAHINTPIFALRAAQAESPDHFNEISLDQSQAWFVMSLHLDSAPRHTSYHATLYDSADHIIWREGNIRPNGQNALTISFRSSFLPSGKYRLFLEGMTEGEKTEAIAHYPFRIVQKIMK
jgi:hypothetical protein